MVAERARVELLTSGRGATVGRFIGEGGQGAVFEVHPDDGSEPLALKWYFDHTASATQRAGIQLLVDRGAPDHHFLWPLEMVETEGSRAFGYVMPLRPPGFSGLTDLLTGKIDASFRSICLMCMKLTGSFLALHNQGLCYRDISFGNLFFDPTSGTPLVCDNDNVGVERDSTSTVLGTRRFMAPEIIRGEALPSTNTDLYSLGVLLFYVLMVGHPLLGERELDFRCWDEHAERQLFGEHPLFVFHPSDRSNAPTADHHAAVLQYWPLYPVFVQRLFVQAFTDGLDPSGHGRVRESVWRAAMAKLLHSIQRCPWCRSECFWDPAHPEQHCWNCTRPLGTPLRLEFGRTSIVLNDDTKVATHVLRHDYDFDHHLAEVVTDPNRPNVWGLRNIGDVDWTVTMPNGTEHVVEQGRAVGLVPDATIAIGATTAVIRHD
jgi:eukaryotic-like serine/threonine-protein kinase